MGTSRRAAWFERRDLVGISKEMYRCNFVAASRTDGTVSFQRASRSVRYPNGVRLWEWLLYIEKRAKASSKAKRKSLAESAFAKACPAIWEYLTVDSGKDGSSRATASLTFFVEERTLKCCVSDKEAGEVAFWSSDSWEELLAAIESDLAAGQGDWRANRKVSRK